MRIAINGFGRIGRCVLRALMEQKEDRLSVVAINSRSDPRTLAHLLRYDSTYGALPANIGWEPDAIQAGNLTIPCLNEEYPSRINWKPFDVDLVLECTGQATSRESAEAHISAGARMVLVSAPLSDADATLIPGCNLENYDPSKHKIISMGSCTLNCLAPTLRVLIEEFGVKNGFATTVHSYTNDQRLLDGSHEDLRRARAAGHSLIPTRTGASQAIGHVFPGLKGKIQCTAIRAPTLAVSLLDLIATVEKTTDEHSVNRAFEKASTDKLAGILTVSYEPLVSVDYKKNPHSAIIDGLSTSTNGSLVRVLAWYDNEWAYSLRLIEIAKFIDSTNYMEQEALASVVRAPRKSGPAS